MWQGIFPYEISKDMAMTKINPYNYAGCYVKIIQDNLDNECFCSLGNCEKEFILGEPVIDGHGNLFHLECARKVYDGFNVKFHVPGVN
tara:strand:+ start:515 stop:778 length:264 start_codon:yes stop_codon:yes gene_type:complete